MFVPFSRFRECAIKLYGQKHVRENFVKFGEAAYFGHIWAKNKFFSGNNGENTKTRPIPHNSSLVVGGV